MTFQWSPITVGISIATIFITLIVCYISWRRSRFSAKMGLLEMLRLLLVLAAVVALNQPEIVQTFHPTVRPTIAVLFDESASMDTEDVVRSDSATGVLQSRHAAIKPLIDQQTWSSLTESMDFVFEPFSSANEEPQQATDLNTPLVKVLNEQKMLRAVVLISDGDWNEGDAPSAAATRLRLNKVPVYAVGVGSEIRLPDLNLVDFRVPTFTPVGKPLQIPFTIESSLPHDAEVQLRLSVETGEETSPKQLPVKTVMVRAKSRFQSTVEWHPNEVGAFDLTLTIEKHEAERIDDNNQRKAKIDVRNESLKVLLIESYPRWEYRYLRNALERDPGVEVHCYLTHPDLKEIGGGRGYLDRFPTDEEIFKYHVVFLGDIGLGEDGISPEQCQKLKQFVSSQAGGLVFLPSLRGKQDSLHESVLKDLLPVVMNRSQPKGIGMQRTARLALTDAGRKSLLTRLEPDVEENNQIWRSVLPGFHWHAAVQRARPGSMVLANHETNTTRYGRIPLIVTRTYGVGKVLFMGTDEAWRWRKGFEDLYHYKYWGQVVRWMAYKKSVFAGKTMRLMTSNDQPITGEVLRLDANVMSTSGEPLHEGVVMVQAIAPSGKVDSIRLQPGSNDMAGLFSGSFVPEEAGEYRLQLTCRQAGETLEQTLYVQRQSLEKPNRPARHEVLREIAKISRGKMKSITDPQSIIDQIAALPEPEPIVVRVPIWSHPIWGGTMIGLLCLFWVGRKMAGVV